MIQTMILAAILAVLVVIARTSPGTLPEAARAAGTAIEQQVRKAVPGSATVADQEPAVVSNPAAPMPPPVAPEANQPRRAASAPAENTTGSAKTLVSASPTAENRAHAVPIDDLPAVEVKKRGVAIPRDIPLSPADSGRTLSDSRNEPPSTTGQSHATDAAPKFMTPRERSRELHRLVRDMEAMFADKAMR